jgi:hypothetical protein
MAVRKKRSISIPPDLDAEIAAERGERLMWSRHRVQKYCCGWVISSATLVSDVAQSHPARLTSACANCLSLPSRRVSLAWSGSTAPRLQIRLQTGALTCAH